MQSLSEQLKTKKTKLKDSQTRITTVDGRSWIEKKDKKLYDSVALCPGFVVDTKPDLRYSRILTGVLLGSQDVAHDLEILASNKITHILNVSTGVPNLFEGWFVYLHKDALDTPAFPLIKIFDECCHFIHSALTSGGTVLVHCNAGVSRSASVVIAYLMRHHCMTFDEAFRVVKEKRSFIRPNEGFIKQLKIYEESLRAGQ